MNDCFLFQISAESLNRNELLRHNRASANVAVENARNTAEAAHLLRDREQLDLGVIGDGDDVGASEAFGGVVDDDDLAIDDVALVFPHELPDPHTGLLDDEDGVARRRRQPDTNDSAVNLNDTLHYEPDGEYEALVQKWVADYIVNAQDYIESSDLTRRVNRWRTKISPVLVLEEERQTFDIHAYGSKILQAFTDTERVLSFKHLVADHSRKEVARMFLSSLMLVRNI